jgi:hypothetical protein
MLHFVFLEMSLCNQKKIIHKMVMKIVINVTFKCDILKCYEMLSTMSMAAMREWVETMEWKRALTVGRAAVLVPTS